MADYDDIRSYIMNDVTSLYPNSSSDGGYFNSPPDRWVYDKKSLNEIALKSALNSRYGLLKTKKGDYYV